jgi:hypothetical protein
VPCCGRDEPNFWRRFYSPQKPQLTNGQTWTLITCQFETVFSTMGGTLLTQSPFAVLTFIVAPAILTNATSVLALSTINRMLRTRERMQDLYAQSENSQSFRGDVFVGQVNRVEKQAMHLLGALRWIYTALSGFAGASLVTLLGAVAGEFGNELLMRIIVGMGFLLGVAGVTGLVGGCLNLLHATQLSLASIREEAGLIRARQEKQQGIPGGPRSGVS